MGKTIIKDDRLVEDFWLLDLAAEGADTAGESAAKNRVVSLEQWQQNRELLLASSGPRGVAISNDDDVLELSVELLVKQQSWALQIPVGQIIAAG